LIGKGKVGKRLESTAKNTAKLNIYCGRFGAQLMAGAIVNTKRWALGEKNYAIIKIYI